MNRLSDKIAKIGVICQSFLARSQCKAPGGSPHQKYRVES